VPLLYRVRPEIQLAKSKMSRPRSTSPRNQGCTTFRVLCGQPRAPRDPPTSRVAFSMASCKCIFLDHLQMHTFTLRQDDRYSIQFVRTTDRGHHPAIDPSCTQMLLVTYKQESLSFDLSKICKRLSSPLLSSPIYISSLITIKPIERELPNWAISSWVSP
jgi:hypothetical protein